MKIIEYTLVFSKHAEILIKTVNEFIKNGWQPYGDYYEDSLGSGTQAMVKYEPDEEKGINQDEMK